MLIGHFLAHYPQPGGTTTMVEGLSRALKHQGHQIVVFRRSTPGESTTRSDRATLDTVNLNMPGRLRAATSHLRSAIGDLGELRVVDVLVVHGMFSPYSAIAGRYAFSVGIPYVVCPHDPYSPAIFRQRRLAKSFYWHLIEKELLSRGRAIHILAPSHARYLSALDVQTPWFVVPNGCSTPADVIDPSETIQRGPVKVLYIGRLDMFNKGIDLLLEAVSQVNVDEDLVTLTLAGRASDKEAVRIMRTLRRSGMLDTVNYVGYVPSADEAILSHDLTVLPSRFDGFGQVVIESLALGRPALVSSQAGVSEYLGNYRDTVLCVPPTVEQLAYGLREAADRIETMRARAQRRKEGILKEFSWNQIAQRWSDELLRIL